MNLRIPGLINEYSYTRPLDPSAKTNSSQQASLTAFSPSGKKHGSIEFFGELRTDFVMIIMPPSLSITAAVSLPPKRVFGMRPDMFRKSGIL